MLWALSHLHRFCFDTHILRWRALNQFAYFPLAVLWSSCMTVKRAKAQTLAGLYLSNVREEPNALSNSGNNNTEYKYKGARPYCAYWQSLGACYQAEHIKAICFLLLGHLCSHCKPTAPGLQWNRAKSTSSWRFQLGCFVLHQTVFVAVTYVQMSQAIGTTFPVDPGVKAPSKSSWSTNVFFGKNANNQTTKFPKEKGNVMFLANLSKVSSPRPPANIVQVNFTWGLACIHPGRGYK